MNSKLGRQHTKAPLGASLSKVLRRTCFRFCYYNYQPIIDLVLREGKTAFGEVLLSSFSQPNIDLVLRGDTEAFGG